MAKVLEFDEADMAKWPPVVQAIAKKLPPDRLYRLKSSGHRVTILSYGTDGTMRVAVGAKYNLIAFERAVFGIPPEDMIECDLPPADEQVGSLDIPPRDPRVMQLMKEGYGLADVDRILWERRGKS